MTENLIYDVHGLILQHLPVRTSRTPSGWTSFDCPICSDKRRRGGVITEGARISYHCFNCGYKAGWSPAPHLSKKYQELAERLGASSEEINAIQLELLKHRTELEKLSDTATTGVFARFTQEDLPADTQSIEHLPDGDELKEYARSRGILGVYPLLKLGGTAYQRRITVPFTYNGDLVGWSSRHVNPPDKRTPKFLSNHQPGYVFNVDHFAGTDRDTVVVVEGLFDAILVDGVAVMSNQVSAEQAHLIDSLGKRVIVCPDRDQAGKKLIEQALALDWWVSFPPWHPDCKDAADACDRYGRTATLNSIMHHATDNQVLIRVRSKLS